MDARNRLAIGWVSVCCLAFVVAPALADGDDPSIDGKPLSQMLTQLRSENRGFQLRAAQALAKAPAGLYPSIVPQLIRLLASERENDRFVAAQTLGEYGPAARVAVPDLLPLLQGTQYERNRAAAAKAFGQILKDAAPSDEVEKVTQALLAVFEDKYSDVRREAVTACGVIGPAAKSSIPAMARRLGDESIPRSSPWVDRTARLLVARAAAWPCGRLGPLAAEHVDRLISMLHAKGDSMPEVVEALGLIGPIHQNVVPNIVDKTEAADVNQNVTYHLRLRAFEALARFGPKAAPALPYLTRFITQSPPAWNKVAIDDTIGALRALRAIGPAAAAAAPAAEKLADPKALPGGAYDELRNEASLTAAALSGKGASPPAAIAEGEKAKP